MQWIKCIQHRVFMLVTACSTGHFLTLCVNILNCQWKTSHGIKSIFLWFDNRSVFLAVCSLLITVRRLWNKGRCIEYNSLLHPVTASHNLSAWPKSPTITPIMTTARPYFTAAEYLASQSADTRPAEPGHCINRQLLAGGGDLSRG